MSQIDKLKISEIRKKLESKQGQSYWKSLEAVAETDEFNEFMSAEFPRFASPLESKFDRRGFVKLLGASLALAGLSSCARPVKPAEKIVPYVKAPEEIIPGKPLFFATAATRGGYAMGVLAESHQGRPTKLEGNPDHPASLGATDATTQAEVLALYDPDRSQELLFAGKSQNWADLSAAFEKALSGTDGEGFYILSQTVTSPTLAGQINQVLAKYPKASWHQYDVFHNDNALEGSKLAFGSIVNSYYDFSKANVIVSLDDDFLGTGPAKLRYSKDFANRRRVRDGNDDMNRLYMLESSPNISTAVADHILPLDPSKISEFAFALAAGLGINSSAEAPKASEELLKNILEDLKANKGASIVTAGPEQPAEVHAIVHAINNALGNAGKTVIYTESVEAKPVNQLESIAELTKAMNDGKVKTLLILGANPVYNAPANLKFADALAKVPLSLQLSQYFDETSKLVKWHIPEAHFLETWSDARAYDGSISIMQPLISPFYGGRSAHEVLAALLGDSESSSYDIIRQSWKDKVASDFIGFWKQTVYQGLVSSSAAKVLKPSLSANLPTKLANEAKGIEIALRLDPSVQDGSYSNNGWMQELPKPITKLTWDNAAYVSPKMAEALDLSTHDLIKISANSNDITVPVWVLPGQAENTISLGLGFGRENLGRIANGVGVNVYPLLSSESGFNLSNATVSKVAGRHKLVSAQMHFEFDGTTERREIIKNSTLANFKHNPEHPHFMHPFEHEESDLYEGAWEYDSYAWGMVIDMNVCTGCNACVSACQAENNIPIVGKKQVEVGRELHWIRVDTYYGGEIDNPRFYTQPINCMQCESAPCEPVCPVGATYHDSEGLNVMVYNRCVGTRYCSNNCPFKVRRFNYLQYAELTTTQTELSLAQNPDVTVRSRGVMEKCTYCTQRIQAAYITAENQARKINDGEIVTACQAACPTEAIVFGDVNDKNSQVSLTKASSLNYGLIPELNLKPRTTYIAKLINPNPNLTKETGEHS
ncbi:MAG TPA: 4Fe-4S dicluster domain-containing protein [Trueperaceae bacterium]|nr:4Fe-4S dicluster domain-containing protein [Trueperaceae bacterium]